MDSAVIGLLRSTGAILKLQLRWDSSERSYKRVDADRAGGSSIRPVRK